MEFLYHREGWSVVCFIICSTMTSKYHMKHILFPTGLFTLWFSRGGQTAGLSMGLQMRIISAG